MKLVKLEIENFKAIKRFELDNLSDNVLIAGPNGCGKSCVFHAIRLLKSTIGGHQENEYNQWFNEFQINQSNLKEDITRLFQTNDRSLKISAEFELHNTEKQLLQINGSFMIEYNLIKNKYPSFFENTNLLSGSSYKARPVGQQFQDSLKRISKECEKDFKTLRQNLLAPTLQANLWASPGGEIRIASPLALRLAFSFYEESLGIIDYHGPDRTYNKEVLGNINVNIQTNHQNKKSHSLYNYQSKYANIKQEMAGDYIKGLLIKESGGVVNAYKDSLVETLKELFNEFFPGKKFLGPKTTDKGGLDFPVQIHGGKNHDINDLSSGEKEVLYGYLRLRNSTPKNSIILLDEPELHLNPRLITGLPRFYKKHIGDKFDNQIFFITHSDALLRSAMKEPGYQSYHMSSPMNVSSYTDNQIKAVSANNDLDRAIIDLVGDLATYSPDKKVVLLEGENSEVDLTLITKLFPELPDTVNLISVGSKHQVNKLHDLLSKANAEGKLKTQFFSIVDRDSEEILKINSTREFIWERYHLENYLLDEYYLTKAINHLNLSSISVKEVKCLMVECAKESIYPLVIHELEQKCWADTFGSIGAKSNPKDQGAKNVYENLQRNINKISKKCDVEYLKELEGIEKEKREDFDTSLKNDNWKYKVRGRDVIKRLTSKIESKKKFSYEVLRNTVISLMAEDGHQPEEMKKVIKQIIG